MFLVKCCIHPMRPVRYHTSIKFFAMSPPSSVWIDPHLLSIKDQLCNISSCFLNKPTVGQSQGWDSWWDRIIKWWTYLQTDQPSWQERDGSPCLHSWAVLCVHQDLQLCPPWGSLCFLPPQFRNYNFCGSLRFRDNSGLYHHSTTLM